MLPRNSTKNLPNARTSNSVFSCKKSLGFTVLPIFPNLFNEIFSQFCPSVIRTKWMIASSLRFLVEHIILMTSEKKMRWIYAKWIITFMQYVNVFRRDTSVSNSPSNSMCHEADSHRTVSMTSNGSLPLPTLIGFSLFDFIPESFFCIGMSFNNHRWTYKLQVAICPE